MYVCMYVYIYMHMCVCIYIYICTCSDGRLRGVQIEKVQDLDKLEGVALETLDLTDCAKLGDVDRVKAVRRVPTLKVGNPPDPP